MLHDISIIQTFSLSEYLTLQKLPITCSIQSSIFTMTYRLSWFGSDLLLLQTHVLPASPSPPTHNAPAIRTAVCFLGIPCSGMLLYLAKWWFLLPKWLSYLFTSGKVLHMSQGPGQTFIFPVKFSWLLGRVNFLFLFASMALCACLYNRTYHFIVQLFVLLSVYYAQI